MTGEQITQNGLGGADVHAEPRRRALRVRRRGDLHLRGPLPHLDAALQQPREPARPRDERPRRPPQRGPPRPGPRRRQPPVRHAQGHRGTRRRGDVLEIHERWAANIICALARLNGQVVGIVANQPGHLAGVLDIEASEKAARFVQMCDAFNIPIITLLDVPGFLPGVDQEHGGIIRHGAKLLYAYCNATVPRISLILRKAYGGAYIVMDSQSIGADITYAWPTNEIAVMGAEGAANVIFRKQIADAEDPEAMRVRMVKEYKAELMHPYYAAERGLVDDVIDPAETREVLVSALAMLRNKHADLPSRKHGNPPQ
ncbi:acyl-CoA carboxylase subunit beta [Streptomyces xanthophaeus]|uniref:acyl-CoA carboxylase subunit beta n=1 Tax=Streptomyces xanthophaeus TaxID=67385 RepID=UPI002648942E|nr:carboxyl transferase domain-containing protein [Streptomyces xanthophaeus]